MTYSSGGDNLPGVLGAAFRAAEEVVLAYFRRLGQDTNGSQTLDDLMEFTQRGVEGLAKRIGVSPAQWNSIAQHGISIPKDWLKEVLFKQLLVAIFEKQTERDTIALKAELMNRHAGWPLGKVLDSAIALEKEMRMTKFALRSRPNDTNLQKGLRDLAGQLMLATDPQLEEYHQQLRGVY